MDKSKRILLTDKDIKLIKEEKRLGYALPFLLFCGAVFFNFFYFFIEPYDEFSYKEYLLIAFINVIVLAIILWLSRLMNAGYNEDLLVGKKDVTVGQVVYKQIVKGEYCLIINGKKYEVEKEIYENIEENDYVEIYQTSCSKLFLGIGIKKDSKPI